MKGRTPTTLVMVAVVIAAGVGLLGCGHETGTTRAQKKQTTRVAKAPKPRPDAPPPEMAMQNELGVVEDVDVEEVIEAHFDEIRNCYQRAGKAQKYAGGKVTLRFLISGSGQAEDVLVIASDLGNYNVERCLVDVGRHLTFKAPDGNKATSFDYPVEFRSTHEMAVLDLEGPKIEHEISGLLPRLAACGRLAADDVTAIMYIEPSGFPGSVGLAAATNFDESVAGCVIHMIQHSRMSTVLPNRVLRCNFNIPAEVASAEPSTRHGASSGAVHRRHR
jgi:TonB family protein